MSNNFLLLKSDWTDLFNYAVKAKNNISEDPSIACVHMRCFAEYLVDALYLHFNLSTPQPNSLFTRLDQHEFKQLIPEVIQSGLHTIRMIGNKAAHGQYIESQIAIDLLADLNDLTAWFIHFMPSHSFTPGIDIVHESLSGTTGVDYPSDELQIKTDEIQQLQALAQPQLRSKHHLQLLDTFAEYDLTDDQQNLVEQLELFFSAKDSQVFLLKGYAGTGKTFITKGLTEYFKSIGRNYVLAAPTGKAAKVIVQKTGSQASTIHKAIYAINDIKQYKEEVEGSETYKFYATLAANDDPVDTVYIIDEASMVSDQYQESEFFRFGSGYLLRDLLEYINLDHNDHQKKIIFIGDNAQLPPVGMNLSPALSAHYLSSEYGLQLIDYELKEVVRQKSESGVLYHASQLRQAMENKVFNQLVIEHRFEDVYCLNYDQFMSSYLSVSDGKMSANTIVLAQSNADVAAYNKRIREHFFPEKTELQPRDKIIVVNNYYDSTSGQMIANGEFGMVKQVYGAKETRHVTIRRKNKNTEQVEEILVELIFRDVQLVFKDLEGRPYSIDCKIVENLLDSDHADLTSDESKAIYVDFCIRHPRLKPNSLEFKDTLKTDPYFNALKIKYGYAITCHKAQGSEWKHVFVKCKTHINPLSAAYFRWFYTAITRTSAHLYLIDPLHIPLGAGLKAILPSYIPEHLQQDVTDANDAANLSYQITTTETHNTNLQHQAIQFDISQDNVCLMSIFSRIQALIADSEFRILDIKHQQYQESYSFIDLSNDVIKIAIHYNAKHQVSSVRAQTTSSNSVKLEQLLSVLKRPTVVVTTQPSTPTITFDQDFLAQFHQRLLDLCTPKAVEIMRVEQKDWHQIYTFKKQQDIAVFKFWYNAKQCFSSFQAELKQCSSMPFVNEINQLLTEDLNV
ncbi:MAG: AAA family ATPase [Acinetobacter sp.]